MWTTRPATIREDGLDGWLNFILWLLGRKPYSVVFSCAGGGDPITLGPGESVTIEIPLPDEALAMMGIVRANRDEEA